MLSAAAPGELIIMLVLTVRCLIPTLICCVCVRVRVRVTMAKNRSVVYGSFCVHLRLVKLLIMYEPKIM